MEQAKLCIPFLFNHTLNLSRHARDLKNRLMNLPLFISRLLIIVFFGLISYVLTGSVAVKSTMGVILAIISLGAAIVFVYLLPKLYERANEEDTPGETTAGE